MHTDCGGVAINSFKQTLHLYIATAEYYDVVSVGEVGHMYIGSKIELLGNPVGLDQESSGLCN